jgi:3-phenylpropionate/trans-cinnamate dioxygenase ferredoxin component
LQVLVFNIAGQLLAIENSCPHAGGSLAAGRLEGRVLRCPSHGMRFDLASGCPPGGSEPRVRTFAISAVAGGALLTLPD